MLSLVYIPTLSTGKTLALTRWIYVGKVMSLLFNMLSRLIITFLPRSKCLNFMAAVTVCSDSGAQEKKVSHYFPCFATYLPQSDGTRCHDFSFLNVELLKKNKLIYFNWWLITLQYCGGFCHTFALISHGCTCFHILNPPLPPSSPSHPSGSSQCTSPEHPVLCIKPGLVIYFTYDNVHVSMLLSQIIPPSPFPTEFKSLFFTSVSPLLSCM